MRDEATTPTRTGLLVLKARAASGREGLSLLRSKREALVRELFAVMDRAVEGRDRLGEAMRRAGGALAVADGLDGRAHVASAAFAARRELLVDVAERNVWGVRLPEIRFHGIVRAPDARGYALSAVSSHTGAAAREFERSLEAVLRSAVVETRIKRIGEEVRNLTRRINRLTEIVLPRIERRIREVRSALEEREREETFRKKRIKGGIPGAAPPA